MGAMLCTIMALQHHITEMVVHPELSQLLHDAGPMLGRIWVFELYSSHGYTERRWLVAFLVIGVVDTQLTLAWSSHFAHDSDDKWIKNTRSSQPSSVSNLLGAWTRRQGMVRCQHPKKSQWVLKFGISTHTWTCGVNAADDRANLGIRSFDHQRRCKPQQYLLKFIEMLPQNSPNQANQASAEYQLCRQMSTWENPKKTIGGLFHILKFHMFRRYIDISWVESRWIARSHKFGSQDWAFVMTWWKIHGFAREIPTFLY